MPARPAFLLALSVLATTAAAAAAEEDCPKHFENYGLFLQAKKSCGKDIDYPFMKIMKACAKQTPQEAAISMMDGGRRAFARGVMRSNLGGMCDEVFAKLSAASEPLRR